MNARKTHAAKMDIVRGKLAAISNMVGFFHIELQQFV